MAVCYWAGRCYYQVIQNNFNHHLKQGKSHEKAKNGHRIFFFKVAAKVQTHRQSPEGGNPENICLIMDTHGRGFNGEEAYEEYMQQVFEENASDTI